MVAAAPAPDRPPLAGVESILADRLLQLHPAPEEFPTAQLGAAGVPEEEAGETSPLLGRKRSARSRSTERRRGKPWWRRPSPLWLLPGQMIFKTLLGASISPELEIMNQVACRAVELEPTNYTPFLPDPQPSDTDSTSSWIVEIPSPAVYDEEWAARCRRSPRVQKRTAAYVALFTMITGVTTALSTTFWGAYSDRHGRKPVIATSMVGELFGVSAVILVATSPQTLGFRFVCAMLACYGALGGPTTSSIISNAFVADCTAGGSRANIFSILDGFSYAGMAFGPLLGALLIRTTGRLLSPHLLTFTLRVAFLFLLIIVPESLSRTRREDEQRRMSVAAASASTQRDADSTKWRAAGYSRTRKLFARLCRKPAAFLAPMAVLLPQKFGVEEDEEHRPLLSRKGLRVGETDWNLPLLGLAYAGFMIVPGITAVKILFARYKFLWGPEEVGYFLSFIGVIKGAILLVVIPFLFKLLRSPTPVPSRLRPTDSLLDEQRLWDAEALQLKLVDDSSFDLSLARKSIGTAALGYTIIGIPTSGNPIPLLVGSGVAALSSGTTPALQSLALSLSSPRDAGRLLAAIGVIESLAVQVIGPPIFGAIYASTLEFWPELVLWSAVFFYLLAMVPVSAIRLPELPGGEEEEEEP